MSRLFVSVTERSSSVPGQHVSLALLQSESILAAP